MDEKDYRKYSGECKMVISAYLNSFYDNFKGLNVLFLLKNQETPFLRLYRSLTIYMINLLGKYFKTLYHYIIFVDAFINKRLKIIQSWPKQTVVNNGVYGS